MSKSISRRFVSMLFTVAVIRLGEKIKLIKMRPQIALFPVCVVIQRCKRMSVPTDSKDMTHEMGMRQRFAA